MKPCHFLLATFSIYSLNSLRVEAQRPDLTQKARVSCSRSGTTYSLTFFLDIAMDQVDLVYAISNDNPDDFTAGTFDSNGSGIGGSGTAADPYTFTVSGTGDLPTTPITLDAVSKDVRKAFVTPPDTISVNVQSKAVFLTANPIAHYLTFQGDVVYRVSCNFTEIPPPPTAASGNPPDAAVGMSDSGESGDESEEDDRKRRSIGSGRGQLTDNDIRIGKGLRQNRYEADTLGPMGNDGILTDLRKGNPPNKVTVKETVVDKVIPMYDEPTTLPRAWNTLIETLISPDQDIPDRNRMALLLALVIMATLLTLGFTILMVAWILTNRSRISETKA